jgi:U3 small nucleolar ribonucleoprotein protein IMP4
MFLVRHHVFVKMGRQVQLAEVGPRFTMKREYISHLVFFVSLSLPLDSASAYEIRQGTVEQGEAEREWVLAHYSRTAKKRKILSAVSGPTSDSKPSKRVR